MSTPTPEVFTASPSNLFAGRNVTALVLDLPDSQLGRGPLAVWARISLYGHAPQQQVSRIGQPMLRPLFFRVPGPITEALNAGNPAEDRAEYSATVTATAATIARLAGIPDPVGHAAGVADAFLPDVLRYQPGQPAHFRPGGPDDTHRGDSPGGVANGRALTDDAFGTALHLLTGNPIAATTSPGSVRPGLPYLGAPDDSDLPPLADLRRGGRR
ncbi:DUF4331 family protein [Modestobacter sp. DSM 44400]|uniref:DUF4331 family protein n=1 Tax=Modestobacter sp. DSM 44400 TaxID=1550230 RepID=UPI0011152BBE|nr:DUF4331 family protein [Modestobacter sp. DSM 44400]